MLPQLDIAIAIVVVLLAVSMLVTIIVQMISALLNLRGTHLRSALVVLLRSMDPALDARAGEIADAVLTHPLVSDSAFSHDSAFLATRLVPAGIARVWQRASAIRLPELKAVLQEIASDPRQLAFGDAGGAEARLDAWFDAAMERASQRFTVNIRVWTAAAAVAVAFLMHFDVLDLYNKVSMDPAVRAQLENLASPLEEKAVSSAHASDTVEGYQRAASDIRQLFASSQYQLSVPSFAEQKRRFAVRGTQALFGILVGAALLSLGSPFWFNALKGLTSLKSTVAAAIDREPSTARPPASRSVEHATV
jgi:hypothetical protein